MSTDPALLSWLRVAGRKVTIEPLPAFVPDSSTGTMVWAVFVANDDESERAHLATCANQIDAELVAEALRRLAESDDT